MKKSIDKQFDVFFSHDQVDESWVKRVKSALVERGFKSWLACDEIGPGQRFPTAIRRGMETCAAVAVVVSPESISSKWVEEELDWALELSNKSGIKLPLIPLLLRTAELPGTLSSHQLVDFRDEAKFDAGVKKLLAQLRQLRPLRHLLHLRKVCFISSEYPPSIVGGLGIHVQKLTTALASLSTAGISCS